MGEYEEEEGNRRPEPPSLHEEDVEYIALLCEVARCRRGRMVRLEGGIVVAARSRDMGCKDGEDGAENERRWID